MNSPTDLSKKTGSDKGRPTGGEITDEALAVLRGRIGKRVHPTRRPWNKTVNEDSVFHFAQGIGDDNPLWQNPEYAANTEWKEIIAPPTYLLSSLGRDQHGLPGVHSFWAGDDWTWHKPLRLGEEVSGYSELLSVEEKGSKFAGRLVIQTQRITFLNQDDVHLATCDRWIIRTERKGGSKRKKYKKIEKKRWSEEEIAEIARNYAAHAPRGETPRYWQDVNVGDLVGPTLKGPLTVTEEVVFFGGAGSHFLQASQVAWNYYARRPRAAVRDQDTNVPDFPIRVHWDDFWAQKLGVPAAYDDAGQRIAWMGQLVTDWMGDSAQMRRLRVELRQFVIVGDLITMTGTVVRKYRGDNDEYLVDLEIEARNQRAEVVAPGTATVELPGKPV